MATLNSISNTFVFIQFFVIHRLINEKYGKAPIGKGQNIKSLEVPNRIISGLWRDSSQRVVTNCTYNLHHFLT